MDDEKLGKAQRLDLLRDLLEELAIGIRCSQMALVETPDPTDIAYLVAFSLGRLGWMADQGLAVAGDDGPGVVGVAGDWLLCPVGRRSHKAGGGR